MSQAIVCRNPKCYYKVGKFCSKRVVVILENGICKEFTNLSDGFSTDLQEKIQILNVVKNDGEPNGRNYEQDNRNQERVREDEPAAAEDNRDDSRAVDNANADGG